MEFVDELQDAPLVSLKRAVHGLGEEDPGLLQSIKKKEESYSNLPPEVREVALRALYTGALMGNRSGRERLAQAQFSHQQQVQELQQQVTAAQQSAAVDNFDTFPHGTVDKEQHPMFEKLESVNCKSMNMEDRAIIKAVAARLAYGEGVSNVSRLPFGNPDYIAMVIVGLCQVGKSPEVMVALWVLCFVHGVVPFLHIKCAGGREAMASSWRLHFERLNDRVTEILLELGKREMASSDRFKLKFSMAIDPQAGIQTGQVVCRLCNATQLRKLIEFDYFTCIKQLGMKKMGDQKVAPVALIFDEDDCNITTADVKRGITEALRYDAVHGGSNRTLAAIRAACPDEDDADVAESTAMSDAQLEECQRLQSTLICKGVYASISVTATLPALALTSKVIHQDRLVKFIKVPIRPDYFGFAFSSLPEERHIKFMDASYPEGDPLQLRRQDSYLKKHPGIPEMLRHLAQDRAGKRVALCNAGVKHIAGMNDMRDEITALAEELQMPLVVITHNGGNPEVDIFEMMGRYREIVLCALGLQLACVVITGAMGGRGTCYMSPDRSFHLTDMFYHFDSRSVTSHAEHVVQSGSRICGRYPHPEGLVLRYWCTPHVRQQFMNHVNNNERITELAIQMEEQGRPFSELVERIELEFHNGGVTEAEVAQSNLRPLPKKKRPAQKRKAPQLTRSRVEANHEAVTTRLATPGGLLKPRGQQDWQLNGLLFKLHGSPGGSSGGGGSGTNGGEAESSRAGAARNASVVAGAASSSASALAGSSTPARRSPELPAEAFTVAGVKGYSSQQLRETAALEMEDAGDALLLTKLKVVRIPHNVRELELALGRGHFTGRSPVADFLKQRFKVTNNEMPKSSQRIRRSGACPFDMSESNDYQMLVWLPNADRTEAACIVRQYSWDEVQDPKEEEGAGPVIWHAFGLRNKHAEAVSSTEDVHLHVMVRGARRGSDVIESKRVRMRSVAELHGDAPSESHDTSLWRSSP